MRGSLRPSVPPSSIGAGPPLLAAAAVAGLPPPLPRLPPAATGAVRVAVRGGRAGGRRRRRGRGAARGGARARRACGARRVTRGGGGRRRGRQRARRGWPSALRSARTRGRGGTAGPAAMREPKITAASAQSVACASVRLRGAPRRRRRVGVAARFGDEVGGRGGGGRKVSATDTRARKRSPHPLKLPALYA